MKKLPSTSDKFREKGQALLLVLLAMGAVLTVVLSAASRSITDVSVTSSEEDALRAFSAAEAGVERSLLTGGSTSGNPDTADSGVTFNSIVSASPEGNDFVFPATLDAGESATFWFVGRNSDGSFTCANDSCLSKNMIRSLCWGASPPYNNASERPAVLLSVYYDWRSTGGIGSLISNQDYTHLKVARKGYDPDSGRTGSNNFESAELTNCTIGTTNFSFRKQNIQFNLADLGVPNGCGAGCLIMAKVRVFYNNTSKPEQIGIDFNPGGTGMPAQGNQIESTGVAGESTRRVNVFQSFAESPPLFDAAVFSLGDFAKN